MTDFDGLLQTLVDHDVEFIVVGGVAGRPRDLEAVAELEAIREERGPG